MKLGFKLFSFRIGSLTPAHKKIYLVTFGGDVVEISFIKKSTTVESDVVKVGLNTKAARINNICKLRGNMKTITVAEMPDDTLVYVGGRSETVAGYSSEDHHLTYLAKVDNKYESQVMCYRLKGK